MTFYRYFCIIAFVKHIIKSSQFQCLHSHMKKKFILVPNIFLPSGCFHLQTTSRHLTPYLFFSFGSNSPDFYHPHHPVQDSKSFQRKIREAFSKNSPVQWNAIICTPVYFANHDFVFPKYILSYDHHQWCIPDLDLASTQDLFVKFRIFSWNFVEFLSSISHAM